MRSDHRLDDEVVQRLVSTGSCWVLWGAHVLVMALKMLVQKVRVHKFSVSPGAGGFVEPFPLVKELMAANSVESAEVSPLKAEKEVLSVGLWLQLEPVTVNVYLITHDDECPNPCQSLQQIETV